MALSFFSAGENVELPPKEIIEQVLVIYSKRQTVDITNIVLEELMRDITE